MLTRLSRFGLSLPRTLVGPPARFVSQSKPNENVGSTAMTELRPGQPMTGHEEVSEYTKNPDYYGFSSDPDVDKSNMKLAFFFGVSMALVLGSTFVAYIPDYGMREWARREAERLIVQREKAGLPLMDENYYDPSKIILPPPKEE
ncbi:NADH dehydrogenase [ubiquinone] 1 beta subcomplex subunit 11, mitochondrial [Cynoglossus semilaevis]|uniref:NADH dehydrogenase [ubiquinone] 1 beta subcomplex subunit 11, mitochondrial n=1 Tax=Cynoglossus semilaevis TaxID=244447 RepID=A0A3P8UYX0_CYNSE|nr:NADH dehydrogenase [ubiquinone] 1 beta subcomplex subunit 11, mitochondrial [Cynoglossus semilaevis]